MLSIGAAELNELKSWSSNFVVPLYHFKPERLRLPSINFTRQQGGRHPVCKTAHVFKGEHKLADEGGSKLIKLSAAAVFLCKQLHICPIYHCKSLLAAWKENIFISKPSIINKCRVKSEYVSEKLNSVEACAGF